MANFRRYGDQVINLEFVVTARPSSVTNHTFVILSTGAEYVLPIHFTDFNKELNLE